MNPLGMIALGLVLMLLGVAIPLLMVLRLIPTGFLLSFVAFASSVAGLLLGILGAAGYIRRR